MNLTLPTEITDEFNDIADLSVEEQKIISAACQAGIMAGSNEGEFYPNGKVTRQEAAVVLCKMLYTDPDLDVYKNLDLFSDVDIWAKPYVNLLATAQIISGTQDGKFLGKEYLTKEALLCCMLNAKAEENNHTHHVFDKGHVTTQPGPFAEGEKVFTCTRILQDGVCPSTRTEMIPATADSDFVFVLDLVSEAYLTDGMILYTYNALRPDGTVHKGVFKDISGLEYTLIYNPPVNKENQVEEVNSSISEEQS